jgi:hypothetical protein
VSGLKCPGNRSRLVIGRLFLGTGRVSVDGGFGVGVRDVVGWDGDGMGWDGMEKLTTSECNNS